MSNITKIEELTEESYIILLPEVVSTGYGSQFDQGQSYTAWTIEKYDKFSDYERRIRQLYLSGTKFRAGTFKPAIISVKVEVEE